jgi:cobalt-precorrin-5B (C1)-methyltransferase
MLQTAVAEVFAEQRFSCPVSVEIFVPRGKKLAEKTLNKKLGIRGGLSILGTTGIVRPLSHEAYTATIRCAVSVGAAMGLTRMVFTTGRRSERHAQGLWPTLPEEAFVQMGDYFRFAMETAVTFNMTSIVLAIFFGKGVKMAQGIPQTHATNSAMTLHHLSEWVLDSTRDRVLSEKIVHANTARHAFDIIGNRPGVMGEVGGRILKWASVFASDPTLDIGVVLFDYNGRVAYQSHLGGVAI